MSEPVNVEGPEETLQDSLESHDKEKRLTVKQTYSLSRKDLIKRTVQEIDLGLPPSPEIVKGLFSRAVLDLYTVDNAPFPVPWPGEKKEKNVILFPVKQLADESHPKKFILEPGASQTFPHGLKDIDFKENDYSDNALFPAIFEQFSRLNPEEQKEVFAWLIHLYKKNSLRMNTLFWFSYFENLHESKAEKTLNQFLLDYISSHKKDFLYLPQEDFSKPRNINSLIEAWLISDPEGMILEITEQDDIQNQRLFLGMCVNSISYPKTINTIRELIEKATLDPKKKEGLEKLGKILLGLNPESEILFHTNLRSIYRELCFENYPPNLEATEGEIDMLKTILEGIPTTSTILDLGTGTGRIALALKKEGILNPVVGIDISRANLLKAKQSDSSQEASLVEADWLKTPFKGESLGLVVSLGRCLCHTENYINFIKVLEEVHRILEKGGVFVFDMPNPERGEYLRNRQRYFELLKNLGVPVEELDAQEVFRQIEYVVDSADGLNFYNRFVPQERYIVQTLERCGFEAEIIDRQPISGSQDSETIYFKAVKK